MNSVVTVGSLLHFILRWFGWFPLIIGAVSAWVTAMAASETDNPNQNVSLLGSLFYFTVGVAMEIAAFFVHG